MDDATSELMGWAAVIVALTAALVAVFSQYNTRKAIEAAAKENREADARQQEKLDAMAKNVNGNLTRIQEVADKFAAEVLRVAQGGAPTPFGEPSAENPVTLSAGKPTVSPREQKK